ncbi:YdgA family protein [Photobacterium sp. ZSDE20]|uniref:YdgA family protein n=1 Tax=Photobacterium pectinilyticum TaxID=2906793 RepID=A0ABT1N7C1_9GAMM|nr:DUF945 family protein [Photobacterium sp. ZSDE20]MCQ1060653.1 YdgA family protein [Photobacterium sp. ZSDE20]MDD1828175.1 YdgA family protein [Photobacterium sp. ZSDE20]
MLGKIGAVGGAVAVALCWPFATGQIGERIYLDTLGQYENPYLAVSNDTYKRGYLTSEAVSKIELKDELKFLFEDEGLPTVWFVKHHVSHGFLSVSSTSELLVDDELKPMADTLWGEGVAPVTFTTNTAMTRKTDFTFQINPIEEKEISGTNVALSSFVMQGTVNAKGAGEFQYQLPSANLTTTAHEEMVLKGLKGGGKGYLDGQFWIGDQSLTLDEVRFSDLNSEQSVDVAQLIVGMENVLIQPETPEGEEKPELQLSNSNHIQVGKLVMLDGSEYQNFNFQMAFSELDYPSLSLLGDMTDDLEEPLTEQQAMEVSAALDSLVAKGLTFSIGDLSVLAPEGQVTSSLNMAVEPGISNISQNIGQIAEKLGGDIHLSLPVELVEADPLLSERVDMLEQSLIVERNATHYLLNMKIDGDKVILSNGDQLPFAMLFMLFM